MYSKDTWKQEITDLLLRSPIYRRLHDLSLEDEGVNKLKVLVIEGVDYAIQRSKLIIDSMKEYTLHDVDHLMRVLQHMGRLIPEKTLNNLNPLELGLLILSAFFHDLGMAPSGKELQIYKGLIKDKDLTEEEIKSKEEFYLYCKSNPGMEEKINELNKTELYSQAHVLENYRLTDFIRRTHAKRVRSVIKEDWRGKLKYKDFDFTTYLISICESHNESLLGSKLPGIGTSILVAEKEYVNSLFIAIVLRLSDLLDFDAKRTPDVLYNHMVIESPVSITEWKKHRTIESWDIDSNKIVFAGKCSHPAIEKSIRIFCDYINFELITCQNLLIKMHDRFRDNLKDIYYISLPNSVNLDQLQPELDLDMKPKYSYKDLQFQLDQNHIMNLLMGTKLYSNASAAVRELLQNSIDACNFRKTMEESWGSRYVPEVNISLISKEENSYLEIEDNGIGMNEEIINNYFTKVGKSYYKSEDFYRTLARMNRNYTPISKFGIGILSVFMVSDTVFLETKRLLDEYDTDESINLTLQGIDAFFWYEKGDRRKPGTKITLKLKDDNNLKEIQTNENLKNYIEDLINPTYISTKIKVNGEELQDKNSDIESWSKSYYEGIEFYDIKIHSDDGIEGFIRVGLLKEEDNYVYEVIQDEREVTVEGDGYTLIDKLTLNINSIQHFSDSINFDGDGVDINPGYHNVISTAGKISVNGIKVDENIFRSDEFRFGKDKTEGIDLPFALYYELNVSGKTDLNLTASRDKIIKDNLWKNFKNQLIDLIFKGVIDIIDDYEQCKSLLDAFGETTIDSSIIEKYELILSKKFPG